MIRKVDYSDLKIPQNYIPFYRIFRHKSFVFISLFYRILGQKDFDIPFKRILGHDNEYDDFAIILFLNNYWT